MGFLFCLTWCSDRLNCLRVILVMRGCRPDCCFKQPIAPDVAYCTDDLSPFMYDFHDAFLRAVLMARITCNENRAVEIFRTCHCTIRYCFAPLLPGRGVHF